ncbi:MAG: ABC transporter ATP-binding protein [Bacteroidota bacterium]
MAAGVLTDRFSFQYSPEASRSLAEISLNIPAGTCCAILGPTGAGKTTLLHAIAGVLGRHHPDAISDGSIAVGGKTFAPLPKRILFPSIVLALQDPYVQISGVRETVYDEVFFTLENLGASPEEGKGRIPSLLKELGIDHLAARKPTTLSGGETQRVALATILVARPEILLLDEPTTALDVTAKERLQRILKSLKQKATVIFTDTHVDFALSVADQIVVLHKGTLLFSGTPKEFVGQMYRFESVVPIRGWMKVMNYFLPDSGHSSQIAVRLAKRLGIV